MRPVHILQSRTIRRHTQTALLLVVPFLWQVSALLRSENLPLPNGAVAQDSFDVARRRTSIQKDIYSSGPYPVLSVHRLLF